MSIEFPVFNNNHRSIKNTLINIGTGGKLAKHAGRTHGVLAADNLTFDINKGDRVGLIGHNGSGKTTLLRAIAGAYEPTGGSLKIDGTVSSLLDISLGMDVDATGYENIYLRGIMMGMTKKEIEARIDEISDFTELGDFLNLPIRTYSSGMHLRLAFAVSTSSNADIIVMDEWLSVGDADFRQKAEIRLKKLINNASILVIATHDEGLVKRICNRVFKMQQGNLSELAVDSI